MSIVNLSINGTTYSLMESTLKRPKVNEKWFAICPAKGDGKWFAKTKEALIEMLEQEEGGVKAVVYKPKKTVMWSSMECLDGKPIVQWFSDGTMDVDTPTARFRIEMAPVTGRGEVVGSLQYPSGEDLFYDFVTGMLEIYDYGYMRGVLTKIRLKNPDGSVLRDIDNLSVTEEGSEVTPMVLMDAYVNEIIEDGNGLVDYVSLFAEDGRVDDAETIVTPFSTETLNQAKSVFLVIDAMRFLENHCEDDGLTESEGNNHHRVSYLSSEDARNAMNKFQSAVDALRSIL